MAGEAGKGSGRRPSEVSDEVIADNWALIWGKKNTNFDAVTSVAGSVQPRTEHVLDPLLEPTS